MTSDIGVRIVGENVRKCDPACCIDDVDVLVALGFPSLRDNTFNMRAAVSVSRSDDEPIIHNRLVGSWVVVRNAAVRAGPAPLSINAVRKS